MNKVQNLVQKLAFSTLLVFGSANAGLISTTTNGGANFVPFGGTVTQYQSMYSGDMFGGGLVEITSLDFFYAWGGDATLDGNFQISLSASSYDDMIDPAVSNVSYADALAEGTEVFSQLVDVTITDNVLTFNGSFTFDSSYNLIVDIVNLNPDINSDWERFKTAHAADSYALGRRFSSLSNSGGTYNTNSHSNEVAIQFGFNVISVPEPAAVSLLSLGLAGVFFQSRRRKKKAA